MPDFSNNNDNHTAPSSSSISMEESEESDSATLSRSEFLTRAEVLRRRCRRLRRLSRIYMDHYWSLIEELKLKHRDYYWTYGKTPFLDENGDPADNNLIRDNCENNNQIGGDNNNATKNRCKANGCKTKAMALTRFCHSHILSDPKQVLYKGCNYVIKSSTSGSILCMKPILRSVVPSLCPLHLEKAEKSLRMALKKGGFHNATTSMTKAAPKCNVIVAESVHLIQSRRRAAQKALQAGIAKAKEHL